MGGTYRFENLQEQAEKIIAAYREKLKFRHYLLGIAVLIFLILFGRNLKAVIVVGVLGVLASYSTFYKRYIRIPSAIELVTIGTVTTSIAYGPLVGALFGATTTLASEIISAAVDVFTFLYMMVRGLIGVVAFYLYSPDTSIVWLGMGMTVLFHAISGPIYVLPGDAETKLRALYMWIMNLSWNFIVFWLLGGVLLAIAT